MDNFNFFLIAIIFLSENAETSGGGGGLAEF